MISPSDFETRAEISGVFGSSLQTAPVCQAKAVKFTNEEVMIIRMLADGKGREQIAARMKWSVSKLRYVLIGARAIARARNDTELVAFAARKGIIA